MKNLASSASFNCSASRRREGHPIPARQHTPKLGPASLNAGSNQSGGKALEGKKRRAMQHLFAMFLFIVAYETRYKATHDFGAMRQEDAGNPSSVTGWSDG